jgi:fructuronate reductase
MSRPETIGLVHLGLGAFHRAHQAWYTHQANAVSAEPVGIWAFTGRRPDAAMTLTEQDCRYTLLERGPSQDRTTIVDSILRASDGADRLAWRDAMARPEVSALTVTITEAGYRLNSRDAAILLVDDGMPISAPARLVDGLRARWRNSGAAIRVIGCDNMPSTGESLRTTALRLAEMLDGRFASWVDESVTFSSSMVDRITPSSTAADSRAAAPAFGRPDPAVVVTEPFSEWVIAGSPQLRPDWATAGVDFVDDLEPYERRKLWLLNAAHSALAYCGLLRGHRTIAGAMADDWCEAIIESLWLEAMMVLPFADADIQPWLTALRERLRNPRIEHSLEQVARDGIEKMPQRIINMQRERLRRGMTSGPAATTALAAWVRYEAWRAGGDDAPGLGRVRALVGLVAPEWSDDPDRIGEVLEALPEITRPALS